MASLKFIMDMDDDEPSSRGNKKDEGPTTPAGSRGHEASSISASHSGDLTDSRTSQASTRRRGASSRSSKTSVPATSSSSSSTAPLRAPALARRPSNTSIESMDQPPNYSQASSSSSGAMHPSNMPNRPMGGPPRGEEMPVKLTPITRRVSRAKKGVPVHRCEQCIPPKTFTRAEHLRRHQLSHQAAGYICTYPGCDRSFYRPDLLARHHSRHEQEGANVSKSPSAEPSTRRGSSSMSATSYEGGGQTRLNIPIAGPSSSSAGGISSDTPTSAFQTQSPYQTMSMNPGMGGPSTPMSPPQPPSGGSSYDRRSSDHSGNTYYQLSSSIPVIRNQPPSLSNSPVSGSAPPFHAAGGFPVPRTSTFNDTPLYPLVTEGLFDHPPELLAPEASPFASSASDSTYSTPSERHNPRWSTQFSSPRTSDWPPNSLAPSFHPTTPQELRSAGDPMLESLTHPHFVNPWTSSPHLTSPHHQPFVPMMDMPISYPEEQSVYDPSQHQSYTSVRSSTPPNLSSSAQPNENLVTLTSAFPDTPSLGVFRKDSAALLGPIPGGGYATVVPLTRTVRHAIPTYLNTYWESFDTQFPLVHRRSFETGPSEDVLRCAMAAVATQFLDNKEDRIRGNQLHEHASRELETVFQWNTQHMQAILLCEFFSRFRGRKAVVRPSRPFWSLYSRVADLQISLPFENMSGTTEDRWRTWLDTETRRRLLAACFVLDVHTSRYHEQPLTHQWNTPTPPIPLTLGSMTLWTATTADTWEAVLSSGLAKLETIFLSETIATQPIIAASPPLDRAVYLASEALRLPPRTSTSAVDLTFDPDHTPTARMLALFPGSAVALTYLALHHTPLHDLLAVSGDSWIFTQKVLPEANFQQQQKRLKAWGSSMRAAAAVSFAAKALIAYLDVNPSETNSNITVANTASAISGSHYPWNKQDISDYWGLYVCVLICWAFGHRRGQAPNANMSTAAAGDSSTNTVSEQEEEATRLKWLRGVASMTTQQVQGVRGRKEILGVLGMVRRRLESDAIGGKSGLLVDAVGVLKKLEEGVNWRWF